MMDRKFFLGNLVKYTGTKFRSLSRSSWGAVVGYVRNQKDEVVVEFGSDTFVIHQDDLKPHIFSDKEKDKGPEVVKITKKWDE